MQNETYIDLLGWRDIVSDSSRAVHQIEILGFWGHAILKKTSAHKEVVIFKSENMFAASMLDADFLESNPILAHAGFVLGKKDLIVETSRAVRLSIVCLVAWDIVHECLQDHFDTTRLGVKIVSDVLKTVGATYLGMGAGLAAAAAGFPVVTTFVIVVAVTIALSMAFEALDRHFHITETATRLAREITDPQKIIGASEFVYLEVSHLAELVGTKIRSGAPLVQHYYEGSPVLGSAF